MPYSLLKIEKEPPAVPADGPMFVALVQKQGDEQPFRVVLERFETEDEARAQVNAWIAEREAEDASAAAQIEAAKIEGKQDSIADSINSTL